MSAAAAAGGPGAAAAAAAAPRPPQHHYLQITIKKYRGLRTFALTILPYNIPELLYLYSHCNICI